MAFHQIASLHSTEALRASGRSLVSRRTQPIAVRPAAGRRGLPVRRLTRIHAVTQPQQSNAERFVEELQLESKLMEPEESVVVASIDELRQRLTTLQAEVCGAGSASAAGLLGAVPFPLTPASRIQLALSTLWAQLHATMRPACGARPVKSTLRVMLHAVAYSSALSSNRWGEGAATAGPKALTMPANQYPLDRHPLSHIT